MTKSTEQQFEAADAAIDRAVGRLVAEINRLMSRWEAVAPTYVTQRAMVSLCDELSKLIDDPVLADLAGPASVKLSNALLDYRDSRWTER